MKLFKYIILYLGLTVLIFSFSNCGGSQKSSDKINLEEHPPFQIEEAYISEWIAGIEEGGSGIDLHILFDSIGANVVFQDVYFRKKIKKLVTSNQTPLHFTTSFKSDLRKDIVMDNDPVKESQNVPPRTSILELEPNEAVLSYTEKGILKYYKVTHLEVKQVISYPSNPNDND
jgi:hypothetical protein